MKLQLFIVSLFFVFGTACSPSSAPSKPTVTGTVNPLTIREVSTDKTYGYTADNPINVGDIKSETRVRKERLYLDILGGPNGEKITYYRLTSCCPFETENGIMGGGMLDVYIIDYGQKDTLYINMYDPGELKIPNGLEQADW